MTTPSDHSDPHLDVVFVHGLGSDPDGWRNKKSKFNWPDELEKKYCKHLRVLNVPYHGPMFNFQDNTAVNVQFQSAAKSFLQDINNEEVGAIRPIVFVAHSLGGIIVKEALSSARNRLDYKSILAQTRCVIFLATPHGGAAIANAAAYLGPSVNFLGSLTTKALSFPLLTPIGILLRPVIGIIASRVRASKLTLQLMKNDAALLSLNDWYRTVDHIETHAFYETELTYACVHVVDPLSADPGVRGCYPIPATKKDHMSISKPEDANDPLFCAVADIIEKVRRRVRDPIFSTEIRQAMSLIEKFAPYQNAGNFADIPAADGIRKEAEEHLRQRFRDLFEQGKSVTAEQEQAATNSIHDIDKFILSLWLERKVGAELKTLRDFIDKAQSSIKAAIHAETPPTAILLYRAARTLDRVLLEFDYSKLKLTLKKAHASVMKRYKADKAKGLAECFDEGRDTRLELNKLRKAIRGFEDVISGLNADSAE
jgi:pimeloyl-ACP methyl ester carboxylesterase